MQKVCLVTGATGALGKATARGLASTGATVVMLARDAEKLGRARKDVASASGSARIEAIACDLSDMDSVRAAVAEFRARHDRLDVLVNNAAVYLNKRQTTPAGLEKMFATNHLGPFLLTKLLEEPLKAASPSRVIFVSAPSTSQLDFDDLQGERKFSALSMFGRSKMANLLTAYSFARAWAPAGIDVNVVHPGLMKSELMREGPAMMRWILDMVSAPPEKAAAAVVKLATAPELAGKTGVFFKGVKTSQSAPYSRDEDVQRRLWEASEDLSARAVSNST